MTNWYKFYVDEWSKCIDEYHNQSYWVDFQLGEAQADWDAHNYNAAIQHLITAVSEQTAAIDIIVDDYRYAYDKKFLLLALKASWQYTTETLPEFTLTWKKICEAWAEDDFAGKEWTIACIDHMRKLMWDEPFNIIWASKPESETG